MAETFSGTLDGAGLRIAVVASRFNEAVTDRLVSGAVDTLRRLGVEEDSIALARVPGAFELPPAAQAFASSGRHDAVVCVGALIRGQTPHFDVLASQVTAALAQLQLASGVPIAFGLLTCDSTEQAIDRAGGKAGNKGAEAAQVAVEMVRLKRAIAGNDR